MKTSHRTPASPSSPVISIASRTLLTLSLAVGVALVMGTGCMKKPNLSEDDLGAEVAPDVMTKTVLEAWGNQPVSDIGVGEFAATDVYKKIADYPPYYVLQDSKEVLAAQDVEEGSAVLYRIRHRVVEDPTGQQKPWDADQDLGPIPKFTAALNAVSSAFMKGLSPLSTPAAKAKGPNPSTPLSYQFALFILALVEEKIGTFHQLSTWTETLPPPPAVAARTGCEGLPDCRWRIKGMSFNFVTRSNAGDGTSSVRSTTRISMKTSPDTPILSRVTEFCMEGLTSTGNGNVIVKECYVISNFRRPTASARASGKGPAIALGKRR